MPPPRDTQAAPPTPPLGRLKPLMGWSVPPVRWVVFVGTLLVIFLSLLEREKGDCPYEFAGAGPAGAPHGSCWCGHSDGYCMCTPSLAIDTIIEQTDNAGRVDRILFVQRKDNNLLAMVGGFVEVGETTQAAVRREVLEETNLSITTLRLVPKIYDDPARDKRRHTVSVVYVARVSGEVEARAGDDAGGVVALPLDEVRRRAQRNEFAFDHSVTLLDYLSSLNEEDS